MKITNDIKYVGVNDHDIDLFEGQYVVPLGMAYNSYVTWSPITPQISRTSSRSILTRSSSGT